MKMNYIHVTSSDGYIIAVPARFVPRRISLSMMDAQVLIQLDGAFIIKGRN